jgi:hypothetical protein
MLADVEILNRRLRERFGAVRGGEVIGGRLQWKYAPDQPWITYGRDDRTIIRRSWASMPDGNGQPLGRVWMPAFWMRSTVFDHFGFRPEVRIPFISEWRYLPEPKLALPEGIVPTERINEWLMANFERELLASIEFRKDSFEQYMGEEAWNQQQNEIRNKLANRERSYAEYDRWTGAMGNLEPGNRGGWMSFQNNESHG